MATQPNVKKAYVTFNGQEHTATYSEETALWSVDITAPNKSSWGESEHVFLMEVHAEDTAGNTVSVTSEDPTYGNSLKIRVLEKTAPTAIIKSPTQNSVLGESTQEVSLELSDAGGSGLNMESVEFKVNGNKIDNSLISWSNGDGGVKTATYTAENLTDGSNSVTFKVTDNDGNDSETVKVDFIISTKAPTLNVITPVDNLITNDKTLTVSGTTSPGSEYVTITTVTVNGDSVDVSSSGGEFTKDITLTEGENTIEVIVTDSAGNKTTVRRTVTLDTKAPVITDITVESTTVDASGLIHVTFKVSEAE